MDKSPDVPDREQELITITDFKITSADTDMEARLRPGALFSFLAHSAYLSADNLGFGPKWQARTAAGAFLFEQKATKRTEGCLLRTTTRQFLVCLGGF